MSDHSELKQLAEAATPGPWAYDGSYVCPARTEDGTTYVELWRSIADCHQPENTKFIAAANPAAVLALIAEVEGLRAQHGRDSAELRSLSQARDYARKERDQLKAEVARSTEREIMQLAEIEALRKDAERYRFISQLAWYVDKAAHIYDIGNAKSPWASEREPVEADDVEAAIDAVMGGGAKP